MRYLQLILFVALASILSVACSEPAETANSDSTTTNQEPDIENDASVDDGGNDQSDGGNEQNSGQVFSKPSSSEGPTDREFIESSDQFSDYSSTKRWGREHMVPTQLNLESWLYVDEYFVLDGAHRIGESTILSDRVPGEVQVFGLRQGEYIPIRVVHVEDESDFPSLEEIESWDEDQYQFTQSLPVEESTPLNYTIVVPPWAFPEEGAHNIQLIFAPNWEPNSDAYMLSYAWVLLGTDVHSSHTVYYGSEEPTWDEHDLARKDDQAERWEEEIIGYFITRSLHLFLAPPRDLYDWVEPTEGEDRGVEDAELGRVIESPLAEVTLKLHLSPILGGQAWNGILGENIVIIRQDDEIIERFLFETEGYDGDDSMFESDDGNEQTGVGAKADVVEIDVELAPGQQSMFQAFAISRPFEPLTEIAMIHPNDSNALFVEYDPDKGEE